MTATTTTATVDTFEEMRALVHQLGTATWALGAIGVAFESGLIEALTEPRSIDELAARVSSLSRGKIERCLAILAATGISVVETKERVRYRLAAGALPFLTQPARAALEGEVRSAIMQTMSFLDSARESGTHTGWRHLNRMLLEAQGAASGGFPPMFRLLVVPALGDLAERLDRPGASFLDVGVGVARLAISMCRVFPALRVVGLDPFEAPLAIARENVAREGLVDRIELRRMGIEELADEGAFDLAWLPVVFIPRELVANAIARTHDALRPGGWILVPTLGGAGDDLQRSVWALQNELWGGPVLASADVEELLRGAGFSSIQALVGPPWAPVLTAGRRPA
jgi:2-polyprenyl-3-methyl-5-hydroxy-6-metoxy-1,4-benzoquinol methylase